MKVWTRVDNFPLFILFHFQSTCSKFIKCCLVVFVKQFAFVHSNCIEFNDVKIVLCDRNNCNAWS
jgi:hypothetical protein